MTQPPALPDDTPDHVVELEGALTLEPNNWRLARLLAGQHLLLAELRSTQPGAEEQASAHLDLARHHASKVLAHDPNDVEAAHLLSSTAWFVGDVIGAMTPTAGLPRGESPVDGQAGVRREAKPSLGQRLDRAIRSQSPERQKLIRRAWPFLVPLVLFSLARLVMALLS